MCVRVRFQRDQRGVGGGRMKEMDVFPHRGRQSEKRTYMWGQMKRAWGEFRAGNDRLRAQEVCDRKR